MARQDQFDRVVALIKSMIPHQVNVRNEKAEPEKYRTVEEIEADLVLAATATRSRLPAF